MPAVSKAQFDKMHVLHAQGKITDQQLANYTVDVNYAKLPERVTPKSSSSSSAKKKSAKKPLKSHRSLAQLARRAGRR